MYSKTIFSCHYWSCIFWELITVMILMYALVVSMTTSFGLPLPFA